MAALGDYREAGPQTVRETRLPWSQGIKRRFGIDQLQWIVLTEVIFPNATSDRSVEMALAYCKVRNLDVFKRPVHIVQVHDDVAMRTVDTVWPGISELRTTAMRTGQFAGFDQTEFGPDQEARIGGVMLSYPEWARCTVHRVLAHSRVAFVGPKVFWSESYGRDTMDTFSPNSIWRRRPRGQLEKCAEAAALRRAFPEELGSEYAAEEVDGRPLACRTGNRAAAIDIRRRLEARPRSNGRGFSTTDVEGALKVPPPDFEAGERRPEESRQTSDEHKSCTEGPALRESARSVDQRDIARAIFDGRRGAEGLSGSNIARGISGPVLDERAPLVGLRQGTSSPMSSAD